MVKNDSGQSRWVEASGVVRSSDTNDVLRLMTSAGLLRVWIGQRPATATARDYSDHVIRVRGVLTLPPDQTPTLLAPSPEFVAIQEEPPTDPFTIPQFTIAQLATLETKPEQQRRIKISGCVTCRLRQGIFIQDETGGAFLQINPMDSVTVGDPVEAVGFPMMDASSVALVDVKLRRSAGKPMAILAPTSITRPEQFAEDQHLHTFVKVPARLLEQADKPEGQLLTLQFGALLFEAALLMVHRC